LAKRKGGFTRSLTMASPSCVFTISRVAELLSEDEELLAELAMEMDPQDGLITVIGTDDLSMIAFTNAGIEYLKQLLQNAKR
jgi:hypothetical protein